MHCIDGLFSDPYVEFIDPLKHLSSQTGYRYSSSQLDDVQLHMSAKYLPHRLRHRGAAQRFHFETAWVPFGGLSLNMTRYSDEVEVTSDEPGDFVALQFSLAGQCAVGAGSAQHEVSPASVWVMDSRKPIYQRMAAGYVQLNVQFKLDALQRFLAQELGEGHRLGLRFRDGMIDLRSNDSSARYFAYLFREAVQADSGSATPLLRRQLERSAMAALLELVSVDDTGDLAIADLRQRPHFVRSAEKYIRENATEDLTIQDIADYARISERSLYQGFNRFLGMSPMQYLKNYRLELARHLLSGGKDARFVTDVAMSLGFTHLGKFAGDYKRRYGETPSQTLRNRIG
jgi:AraC-like DNA-binding protein